MIKTNYEITKGRIKIVKNEDFYENFFKSGNIYTMHLVSENEEHVLFKIKKFGQYWKMSHGTIDVDAVLNNETLNKIIEYDKYKNEISLQSYIKTVCSIIETN